MDINATQILDEHENVRDEEKIQIGTLHVGTSEHKIVEGLNRIGRAPPCSVVLSDSTVSRVHAEIHAGSESAFITDLRSVNGTTLKDLTLKHFYFYPINDGDVIIFGGVRTIFSKTKEFPKGHVENTPRTGALRGTRESPFSSTNLALDSTFDDSNGSVVMGSQQIDSNRRLFRRPAMPANRSINRGRISEIVESPERVEEPDKSRKGNDSPDIYSMETQNILEPVMPASKKATQIKRTTAPEKSSKNVDQLVGDVHEMETQSVFEPALQIKGERTMSGSSEREERPAKSSNSIDHLRDIHEIETQNMLEPALQIKSVVSGSSKKGTEPGKSSKNVHYSRDIHGMGTQETANREAFLAPKRRKLDKSAEVSMEDVDNSVYEAETQVISAPGQRSKTHEDSCSDDENIVKKCSPKEPSVIAETDDESRSDDGTNDVSRQRENNDLSDGSITDDENQFATLSTQMKARSKEKVSPKTPTITSEMKNRSEPENNAQNGNLSRASTTVRNDDDETDIDLLPTQVLDVVTSTPMSNRWNIAKENIDESQVVLDDIDIHNALTQVAPANHPNSPDSSTEIPEKTERQEDDDRKEDPNPNDTLDQNMGNIFGNEVTSEGEPMDEPTQLMTQNLVDILKPTQIVTSETTRSSTIPESPEAVRSPGEKGNETGEILGFVDGRAVSSQGKVSCLETSTSADKNETRPGNSKEKTPEPANSDLTLPPCSEDDDMLFGLPKVQISGTLSNPESPASSETSDNDLIWPKKWGKNEKMGSRTKSKFCSIRTRSNVDETRDVESPVLSKKSRVMGKNISSSRIGEDDDNDSDEDLDYNDLKKIADRLLASGSANETNVRKATGFPGLNVEKSLPTKRTKRHPTRKLSETPSSLTVTDPNDSDSSEDGNENKVVEPPIQESRKRPRESARNGRARKKNISKESPKESREVDDVVAPNDRLTPVMTQKQYAKVHLTRLNVSEFKAKKAELPESKIVTPKVTRHSNSKIVKDSTPSPTTPARSRSRRTIEPNVSVTNQHHKVLFTCVKDEDYEKMVVQLGGTVVSDPSKATVLITDKVRRTYKFLCAVAQGIKVVSVNWLIESIDAGHFLDCDNFILQDPEAEEKFKFKLAKSLQAARTNKFLTGFTILVTPKVNQPEIHEIKGMVEASGGRVLVRVGGRSWSDKMVIVSRKDDLAAAKAIISKSPKGSKISVQSTEFLLTGILRQEVNLVDHKLL